MAAAQEKITLQAKRAVDYAREEAARRGSALLEPEHLLLGLLKDQHSAAFVLLESMGYDASAVCERVSARFEGSSREEAVTVELVQASERTLLLFAGAAAICARERRKHIGPRHILIALLEFPTPLMTLIWEDSRITASHIAGDADSKSANQAVSVPEWHERDCAPPTFVKAVGDWSRSTQKTQQVIFNAQREAYHLGHAQVSPLFLLAGLLRCEQTVAEDIFLGCGTERTKLCEAVIYLLEDGGKMPASISQMAFDPDSLKIFARMYRYRSEFEDRHIGTEHLLLALLAEKGAAGNFLRSHGLTTANVLAQIRTVKRAGGIRPRRSGNGWIMIAAWLVVTLSVIGLLFAMQNR